MPWTEHGNYYHYEEYLSETEEVRFGCSSFSTSSCATVHRLLQSELCFVGSNAIYRGKQKTDQEGKGRTCHARSVCLALAVACWLAIRSCKLATPRYMDLGVSRGVTGAYYIVIYCVQEWNAILLSAVADADFQTVHRLRRRGASVNAKDQEVSVLGCSPLVNSDKRRFSTGTERTVDSLPQL